MWHAYAWMIDMWSLVRQSDWPERFALSMKSWGRKVYDQSPRSIKHCCMYAAEDSDSRWRDGLQYSRKFKKNPASQNDFVSELFDLKGTHPSQLA